MGTRIRVVCVSTSFFVIVFTVYHARRLQTVVNTGIDLRASEGHRTRDAQGTLGAGDIHDNHESFLYLVLPSESRPLSGTHIVFLSGTGANP